MFDILKELISLFKLDAVTFCYMCVLSIVFGEDIFYFDDIRFLLKASF